SQSAFVEVTELETCIIPQGISPNNDGYNDTFDLSSFDVQSLEIFNRNGRKVYSKTNYTNQWEGQSDSGDILPVGTYYYVMKYQGTKTKAAWVYLN
ncbi:gliding motility-associated C-terminal domain-containing protein, partial [uncultured Olleya sp.]|uniref:gliding motility-associated C-terminal domain-containing protein n=1 Tax=uncultured Olleya sp. TaxID=757243 RepID=UPI00259363D2